MRSSKGRNNAGFTIAELLIAMTIMLVLLTIVSALMARTFGVRSRESRQADALATAQSALSVISREISNSGFGIYVYEDGVVQEANNGIVLADSNANRIRVRANLLNAGGVYTAPAPGTVELNQPGEDVTYFFDPATESIVRHDANGGGPGVPTTSVVVNRISNVRLEYFDYFGGSATPTGPLSAPTADTGRVRITVLVALDPVVGQPSNQVVSFTSDVSLRNSSYMLQQY